MVDAGREQRFTQDDAFGEGRPLLRSQRLNRAFALLRIECGADDGPFPGLEGGVAPGGCRANAVLDVSVPKAGQHTAFGLDRLQLPPGGFAKVRRQCFNRAGPIGGIGDMNGYLSGRLSDDEGAAELLKTAKETVAVGKRLGVARLNLHGTGLGEGGLPVTPCETVTGAMWLKARDTLNRIADLAEAEGVTFTLENLNLPVDHPGVPFGRAEDTLALVSDVNRPGLRLNLDLYHAEIARLLAAKLEGRPIGIGPVLHRNGRIVFLDAALHLLEKLLPQV